ASVTRGHSGPAECSARLRGILSSGNTLNLTYHCRMKPDWAVEIVNTLRRHQYEAYFVGGCVRDMVMGLEPADYDIATSARPDEIIRIFPRTEAVGMQFGVMLV